MKFSGLQIFRGCHNNPVIRPTTGAKWVISEAKGGAYDPKWALDALQARIDDKVNKPHYPQLKSDQNLSELVLLVHYGVRGIIHNTPFEGVNRKLDEVITEVRARLLQDHGPFDRVFLYLAFNEGRLIQLYP